MAFYVWLYCIGWWFVQDTAKVILYWWMEKNNIFGINDSLKISKELQAFADAEASSTRNPLTGDEEAGASLKKGLLAGSHMH
eukprot:CAMPEP_0173163574 /NCGR_PEP_ID=MMETSP1105-20130129/20004_1 /TAXON_ID=2985 /ORGANISM="Ochromonas sp., Strain BG-1" /LENGTH=81 /DNA_ID=CAMNT_0014083661 /DNA_START=190 /DNA_END=435 /DNA_ORIENTATION=-